MYCVSVLQSHPLCSFSSKSAFTHFLTSTGSSINRYMRYAVLVTGPAGAGKTTFSNALITHLRTAKRAGHLVNLDPAAEVNEAIIDIKELVSLEDVMDELGYGPNGGLVYCFE